MGILKFFILLFVIALKETPTNGQGFLVNKLMQSMGDIVDNVDRLRIGLTHFSLELYDVWLLMKGKFSKLKSDFTKHVLYPSTKVINSIRQRLFTEQKKNMVSVINTMSIAPASASQMQNKQELLQAYGSTRLPKFILPNFQLFEQQNLEAIKAKLKAEPSIAQAIQSMMSDHIADPLRKFFEDVKPNPHISDNRQANSVKSTTKPTTTTTKFPSVPTTQTTRSSSVSLTSSSASDTTANILESVILSKLMKKPEEPEKSKKKILEKSKSNKKVTKLSKLGKSKKKTTGTIAFADEEHDDKIMRIEEYKRKK